MRREDFEFELDDEELQFLVEEDPTAVASGGDYGGPVETELDDSSIYNETLEDENDGEGEFAQRFYELSLREFDSEVDLDRELDELLTEMEREYFLKGLIKKIAKGAGSALKSAVKSFPGGKALNAITSLASGALKGGMLKPLAKAALSFVPGGSMALPVLDTLGFGGGGGAGAAPTFDPSSMLGAAGGFLGGFPSMPGLGGYANMASSMMPWQNMARLFQDSFGELAARTQGEVTDPTHGMQLANQSFQSALRKQSANAFGGLSPDPNAAGRSAVRLPGHHGTQGRPRVVYLSPGEEIVIRVRS